MDLKSSEPNAKVKAGTADKLDLGHLLKRKPSQLSGGQRHKGAHGTCARFGEPRVFLFDELPVKPGRVSCVQMRSELVSALHREVGTTSVYVTHDQIVTPMTLGTRIAVLVNHGELQQVAPTELFIDPRTSLLRALWGP